MAGPLTDLRERNQRDYQAYYARHPEQTLKDQERQDVYQDTTRAAAARHGEPWTGRELDLVFDFDVPIKQAAEQTGRTYAAVRQARHRRVKQERQVNELIKDETEPYDGSQRHIPAFSKGGAA